MKDYQLAIFLFRRDLRLVDNTGLRQALEQAERVLPLFILDPRQASTDNPYLAINGLRFMFNSLSELDQELGKAGGRLYLLEGKAEEVIDRLLGGKSGPGVDAVFFNRDYTPFSRKRDQALTRVCEKHNVAPHWSGDALLNEPETTLKSDGTPYTVFTPFFRRASQIAVPVPRALPRTGPKRWFQEPLKGARHPADSANFFAKFTADNRTQLFREGGRKEARAILKRIADHKAYSERRDIPSEPGTTGLSAHMKFGTLSAREFYHAAREALGPEHALIRQLYWRDFFTQIAFYFPHVFGKAFRPVYDAVPWKRDKKTFAAWCQGRTGFPIVDAGMSELTATGYMHNRVRMITASFLTKDLHLDWRWGEKFFARHLLDYDPAVNNGSWQWAASTGCDAQPYFRVFNPWLQQKKFDPDCVYIKRWIPELGQLEPKAIHKLNENPLFRPADYPAPIVEHSVVAPAAKAMFKNL